ncbi:hypothetical protein [Sphingomonas pseudosanguinis]|uniref:Uncharacterized protein n=1 Tax=Sphingomonas pseudosanguinis TaxID=413712 RepID=A0A7W6F1E9_9SPHN|nr:hypothetical protein [Sphingomonas pseudosanguinis]MBB3877919.1 hypothetical protein [Sphingomonas pseudosanguinis]MBN3537791.1 hypothetical protein [Sphingomonas pseudosanguinis]
MSTPVTQTPDATCEAIRQFITKQLDELWRDRVILPPEQWNVVLAALSNAKDDRA